jgi:iron uptake system component EfeO
MPRVAPLFLPLASGLRRAAVPSFSVLLAAGALTACAGSTSSQAAAVSVAASDTACTLSTSTVAAGSSRFEVKNGGNQVTEVYVYRADGSIAAEKENIGPGTSASFTADLGGGTYTVACKPGQKGDGIRTTLTVTGAASTVSATPTKDLDEK